MATRADYRKVSGYESLPGGCAISGTHIAIKTHIENPNDYINQKFSTLFSLKTKSVDFN